MGRLVLLFVVVMLMRFARRVVVVFVMEMVGRAAGLGHVIMPRTRARVVLVRHGL